MMFMFYHQPVNLIPVHPYEIRNEVPFFFFTRDIEDGTISGTEPVISPALCGTPSFPTGVGSTCENKAPNKPHHGADGPMGMKGATDPWNLPSGLIGYKPATMGI